MGITDYTRSSGRVDYMQVRNTSHRCGAHVPSLPARSLPREAKFVDPKDDAFNEMHNFACSLVGEICSQVRNSRVPFEEKNLPEGTLYMMFGFHKYLDVTSPCMDCQEQ